MSSIALRRVAVSGAGGFVGRALCRQLATQGIAVRALVRHAGSMVPAGAEAFVLGDMSTPERCRWDDAVAGMDAVFHLAAVARTPGAAELWRVNVEATGALARASFRGGARLVHASTIKVLGERSCGVFDDDSVPAPADDYGRSKLEAERRIASEANLHRGHWIALRPPIVFGAGEAGNFRRLVRLAVTGWPMPLASVNNRRSMIHVDAFADALLKAAGLPQLPGGCHVVAGGPAWSTPRWLQEIASAAGRPSRLWRCPPGLLQVAAGVAGAAGAASRLLGSLAVDDRGWRTMSGWQPPASQEQAVRSTVCEMLDQTGTNR